MFRHKTIFKDILLYIYIYIYTHIQFTLQCYITEHYIFLPHPVALRPNAGLGFVILDVSRSHTTTQHNRQDSSGRVISPSQRPLPDNTQHSQQTDIHTPGGIGTHNISRRAAVDLRLRPWGSLGPAY